MAEESATWYESDTLEEATPRAVRRQVGRLLKRDGRALVTVVGRFHGPRKYEPPDGLDPGVAELLRKANSRYGHMEAFRFQFEPLRIEDATAVAKEVP
jgi:hypothetical protein